MGVLMKNTIKALLTSVLLITALSLLSVSLQAAKGDGGKPVRKKVHIVTSDTILGEITKQLLPSAKFTVTSIMPSDQCPAHFDISPADIRRVADARLIIDFTTMPPDLKDFSANPDRFIAVSGGSHNWMVPDIFIRGVNAIAKRLMEKLPRDSFAIEANRTATVMKITRSQKNWRSELSKAGIPGHAVVASEMQREPLEWMGFRVVATYGRPETLSAGEIAAIVKTAKKQKVILVVDNMQSGPKAGKGIAQTLGVPHVTLSNFPDEKGYVATVNDNLRKILRNVKPVN